MFLNKISFYGVDVAKPTLLFFCFKDNPLYMSIQVYTFIRFLLNFHSSGLFRPTLLFGMGEYIIPHSKALVNVEKFWGGHRCGSSLSL